MSENVKTYAITIPAGIISASREKNVLSQIDSLSIVDDATYLLMGDLLKAVKSLQAEVDMTFDSVISSAHKAHESALAAKRIHSAPLMIGEMTAKSKLKTRDEEIKRARIRAEVAEREAREKQEAAERKAREEEAEQRRQAEMALQLAMEAEEQGDRETADEFLADAAKAEAVAVAIPKPEPLPVARPLPAPPKIAGISSRVAWRWKVTDLSLVPRAYLTLNETMLNTVARTTKGTQAIPGIEFYSETEIYSGKLK